MAGPEVIASPIKVALVGGGFIGPVHAEALRRIGVEVVGLLGSSPDRAEGAARRLGIPRVYRDLWVGTLGPEGRCSAFEEWPFFPGQPLSAREAGAP